MLTNVDKTALKNAQKFNCNYCDFGCSKLSEWNRHVLTLKHQNVDKMLTNVDISALKNATPNYLFCDCGKKYSHRQSLNIHRKKCTFEKENNNSDKNEIIEYLLKANSDLKTMVIDVCKQIQPNTNNISNSHINSHNKTFNLNVFLNEQCKDAMNITEFVESLQIQLSDLENVGKMGFVEGISNIIIKNLKDLDVTQRPIHCTDKKREILYVKDEDKWEKENESKQKIRKAIKKVAHKNTKMLKAFRDKHPDCGKSDSKYSDQYNKLVIEAMGGRGDNDLEKEDKIIKNIAKNMVIEK